MRGKTVSGWLFASNASIEVGWRYNLDSATGRVLAPTPFEAMTGRGIEQPHEDYEQPHGTTLTKLRGAAGETWGKRRIPSLYDDGVPCMAPEPNRFRVVACVNVESLLQRLWAEAYYPPLDQDAIRLVFEEMPEGAALARELPSHMQARTRMNPRFQMLHEGNRNTSMAALKLAREEINRRLYEAMAEAL